MDLGTDYRHLSVRTQGRDVWATIDNPPLNLITRELLIDLLRLSERVAAAPASTVVVLQSANPTSSSSTSTSPSCGASRVTPHPDPSGSIASTR